MIPWRLTIIQSAATLLAFIATCPFASASGDGVAAMSPSKVGRAASFVRIRGGSFKMGSPEGEEERNYDETLHKVKLHSFEIQATPVTQLQFVLMDQGNPSKYNSENDCTDHRVVKGFAVCPNQPVEDVSWYAAVEFIDALNEVSTDYQYRLPTEAELEYAIRGGTQTPYFSGSTLSSLQKYARALDDEKGPGNVGQKKPNPYGLYDIVGHVWQWASDWYGDYPEGDQLDPTGPISDPAGAAWKSHGNRRVLRGGDWHSGYAMRSASRLGYAASQGGDSSDIRGESFGFRLVRIPRKTSH